MRAVFTVSLRPSTQEGQPRYPSNDDIVTLLRGFGWETSDLHDVEPSERPARYEREATRILSEMPELADDGKEPHLPTEMERRHIIFWGFFAAADEQTEFLVTRPSESQVNFRLLHKQLPNLQRSTLRAVRRLRATKLGGQKLDIANRSVLVYERGFNHVVIRGRVRGNSLREAVSANAREFFLFVVAAVVVVPLWLLAGGADRANDPLWTGTWDRLSTVAVTTAVVSLLGFLTTVWDMARHRVVFWDVDQGKYR
jgi:hypothetical protein